MDALPIEIYYIIIKYLKSNIPNNSQIRIPLVSANYTPYTERLLSVQNKQRSSIFNVSSKKKLTPIQKESIKNNLEFLSYFRVCKTWCSICIDIFDLDQSLHHHVYSQIINSNDFGLFNKAISKLDPSCNHNLPLRLTCKLGNFDMFKSLMQLNKPGCHINPHSNNSQAFRYACKYGHLAMVEWLLMYHKINVFDHNGDGFIEACRGGHYKTVKYILDYLIDNCFNCHNKSIEAGFIISCKYGYIDILTYIIDYIVENYHNLLKINIKDKILYSAECMYYSMKTYLINKGIKMALKNRHIDIVLFLLDCNQKLQNNLTDVNPNYSSRSKFILCHPVIISCPCDRSSINDMFNISCHLGYTDVVRRLINEDELDINNNNNYPIKICLQFARLDIIKIMIESSLKKLNHPNLWYEHSSPFNNLIKYNNNDKTEQIISYISNHYNL